MSPLPTLMNSSKGCHQVGGCRHVGHAVGAEFHDAGRGEIAPNQLHGRGGDVGNITRAGQRTKADAIVGNAAGGGDQGQDRSVGQRDRRDPGDIDGASQLRRTADAERVVGSILSDLHLEGASEIRDVAVDGERADGVGPVGDILIGLALRVVGRVARGNRGIRIQGQGAARSTEIHGAGPRDDLTETAIEFLEFIVREAADIEGGSIGDLDRAAEQHAFVDAGRLDDQRAFIDDRATLMIAFASNAGGDGGDGCRSRAKLAQDDVAAVARAGHIVDSAFDPHVSITGQVEAASADARQRDIAIDATVRGIKVAREREQAGLRLDVVIAAARIALKRTRPHAGAGADQVRRVCGAFLAGIDLERLTGDGDVVEQESTRIEIIAAGDEGGAGGVAKRAGIADLHDAATDLNLSAQAGVGAAKGDHLSGEAAIDQ